MCLHKRSVEKIYRKKTEWVKTPITANLCEVKSAFSEGIARKKAKHWGQRAYECPVCFKWHLTKKDRR